VSAQGDQVIYEYLSRVSDAGMQVLAPERRVQLVAGLRKSIDEARRRERADSADAVRRLLKRFGDPNAIVNVAAGRSSGASQPRAPRMPGAGARPPAGSGPPPLRGPKMPTASSVPPVSAQAPAAPPHGSGVAGSGGSSASRRAGRPRRPQQPHAAGAPAPSTTTASAKGTGTAANRPGGPPLPPLTQLRRWDPDSVRFWAKGQVNSGTRLDLLSLFILGVASVVLPILGFIGGAVMVHQTKAYKTEDELVALAAIPVLAFVFVIAVRWPNDPTFAETMAALADALATATAIGGVLGAGFLWSRQGQRAAAEAKKAALMPPARPAQAAQAGQAAQGAQQRPAQPPRPQPRPTVQPSSAERPPASPRSPAPSSRRQSGSPRRSGVSGTLSQWFPPRPPR
jgi:hypothetical protein